MDGLERALRRLGALNDLILGLARALAWALVAGMTVAILLQVLFRYGLGGALTWSEEAARFMMIWMTFLVAPIAYRLGANVNLDIVVSMLGGRPLETLKLVINLLIVLFVVTFFVETFGLIGRSFAMKASTLPVQMGWVYMILPTSMVLMALVALELIGRNVVALIDPDHPAARPPGAAQDRLLVD
ncbi:MAG: TRAP transporter small permease [Geminicoccaceae bacterium]|nr:TRAP transporter small permease [Geminicoccaceae bacterium]